MQATFEFTAGPKVSITVTGNELTRLIEMRNWRGASVSLASFYLSVHVLLLVCFVLLVSLSSRVVACLPFLECFSPPPDL